MTNPIEKYYWKGGAASQDDFLGSVGTGMSIVYKIDPELASRLEAFIQTGKEIGGMIDSFIGGTDAEKGASLMAVVDLAINLYAAAIERRAAKSKSERDRKLSDARQKFIAAILDNPATWPYAVEEVPHISISISGGGLWTPGGDFHPAIYKPENKGSSQYRYLEPGPTRNRHGCAADVPTIGSVEGTNSSKCKGQIGVYPLFYPCWREKALSLGAGEWLRSSDLADPGAAMLAFQMRMVLEPRTNLKLSLSALADVVSGFEERFWTAVKERSNARRDSYGVVGPPRGDDDQYIQKDQATRAGCFGNNCGFRKGGICGLLNSPGETEKGEWANGIQVLDKKPADPNLDQRFYLDKDGIIRHIWNEEDLETCGVLSWGGAYSYDPDTGDRGMCTLAARNVIWAQWLNIRTARQFWATRDYVREDWKAGKFSVDAGALPLLEGKGPLPVRRLGLRKAEIKEQIPDRYNPLSSIPARELGGKTSAMPLLLIGGAAVAIMAMKAKKR